MPSRMQGTSPDGGPGFGGLIGGGEAELAFAVVAEAAGFEDGGEADFADGCVERDEVVDGGEGCDLEAAVEEEVFLEEAVLRGGDGARVGEEREAVKDMRVDVLALDGEEVDGFCELGDGVRVVEVDGEDGCDLLGAVAGAAGAEDVGVDGGRGLGEHEGELAGTEDADARTAGGGHARGAGLRGSGLERTVSVCERRKVSRARAISESLRARMDAAKRPAFFAPELPIAKVATGTPPGICTMESSESTPWSACDCTGTPSTGRRVFAATMPGRCAAPPAPAMMTRMPRDSAVVA